MVKKSATFIAGPRKKNGQLMLKRPKLIKSFQESIFKGGVKQGALRKWSALAQFSDWLILRSQCGCLANLNHQLSDSSWSGVYMLVVSMHMVGVSVSAKLKNMIQDIMYSPWGKTKDPWLCFMAKHLFFFLAWPFSFAFAFSHFSKFALWNSGKVKAFL